MYDARVIVTERYDASEYGNMNENNGEEKKYYTSIGTDYLFEAMNNLTHSELLLWLAFMSNENKFAWNCYYKQIQKRTGMSMKSFHRAFIGLVQKGYITHLQRCIYVCHLSATERRYSNSEILEQVGA